MSPKYRLATAVKEPLPRSIASLSQAPLRAVAPLAELGGGGDTAKRKPAKKTLVAIADRPREDDSDEDETVAPVSASADDAGGDEPIAEDGAAAIPDAEVDLHAADLAIEKVARSLSRVDPLTIYVQQIRRFPLLDREKEHELAVRYVSRRDEAAGRTLVEANLRLVVKIAHEYKRAHANLLDLVQEGNLGLLQSLEKYDPNRGVKVSSYAAWWIRAYMLRFILNNARLVKLGTTAAQRKLFFNLSKEKQRLEALGVEASPKTIAGALDVPERDVVDMEQRLSHGELSLDTPVGRDDEGGRTHVDLLESPGEAPDEVAEARELRRLLHEKLTLFGQSLHGRERVLFEQRLLDETPKTLRAIGKEQGISAERTRQLEKRLIDKLRKFLDHDTFLPERGHEDDDEDEAQDEGRRIAV